ncbi:hypothetical protein NHX12_018591 [Muraenolepis orangiensis]|uniref:Storkhead-box protein 1 n=1 Tax=Muraenolepis orangiensis TaxID=630683 RepID=A0A9Q0EYF5_9TELE|nr:hypothetical protein NHX12_018591 [Muraenolepis orangiensis]
MAKCIQIAPHAIALVLSRVRRDREDATSNPWGKLEHHAGYEIFANFKAANMQNFWNKTMIHAVSELFFLGWVDQRVLLVQGKEEHLDVLRNAWSRRVLNSPPGFRIKCLGRPTGLQLNVCHT